PESIYPAPTFLRSLPTPQEDEQAVPSPSACEYRARAYHQLSHRQRVLPDVQESQSPPVHLQIHGGSPYEGCCLSPDETGSPSQYPSASFLPDRGSPETLRVYKPDCGHRCSSPQN